MAHKYVYLFKEGNAQMRNLLGGKGANPRRCRAWACRSRRAYLDHEACTAIQRRQGISARSSSRQRSVGRDEVGAAEVCR